MESNLFSFLLLRNRNMFVRFQITFIWFLKKKITMSLNSKWAPMSGRRDQEAPGTPVRSAAGFAAGGAAAGGAARGSPGFGRGDPRSPPSGINKRLVLRSHRVRLTPGMVGLEEGQYAFLRDAVEEDSSHNINVHIMTMITNVTPEIIGALNGKFISF